MAYKRQKTVSLITNTQQGQNADSGRALALKKVQTAASEANIDNGKVKEIIAWKYKKDNSNGLNREQLEELAANIANYYDLKLPT